MDGRRIHMNSAKLLFPLLLLVLGCKEAVTELVDDGYPSPVTSHEVLYDAAIFQQRRDALVQRIPSGSIVFITTTEVFNRNGDVSFDFRPSSTFYYLTGFQEPNAVAVIRKKAGSTTASELVMFVEERTADEIQWLGPVAGISGAIQYFKADSAYDETQWPSLVGSYLTGGRITSVYANLTDNAAVDPVMRGIAGSTVPVMDVKSLVNAMRTIKSSIEIESLRRGARVSVQAFEEAITSVKPQMYEYEMAAVMECILRLNGCPRLSFPTIVASGPNIVTIHYNANSRQMQSGDLVMADYGAEYGYYAADVTRTVPVNGTFTREQGVVYDIVKEAYDAIVAAARPGANYATLAAMQRDLIIDRMIQAGIILGDRSAIVSSGQYRLYIPAGMGHMVGLDVHDPWPAEAGGERILRENMVIAVEPHIYLGLTDATVASAYRGVCARIENDLLITDIGNEDLSRGLPTARLEIEAMMRR
jgi:Xaa-Pro aminopeptidase